MGNRFAYGYTDIAWPAPANIVAYSTTRQANIPPTPSEPIWLQQVHGNRSVLADRINCNAEADASYTRQSNTVCIVKTADCLPILMCNKQGTEVAAIHAGWRSLASGIIPNTCANLKSNPKDMLVWLGPAIGPEKFEVGQDVLDQFAENYWDITMGFRPHGTKWLVDLYYLARLQLQKLGFARSNIYGGNWCTYSDADNFYSYRRSKDVGRMAHLIWLK